MVPVSKRGVYLNGTLSKYFVLLHPSRSPATTSSYDHLHPSSKLFHSTKSRVFKFPHHRRKQPQQCHVPVKGTTLAAPPRNIRCAHPKWHLPGISLLQRRHSPIIRPSTKNGNPRRSHDATGFFIPDSFTSEGHKGKLFRSADTMGGDVSMVSLPTVSKRGLKRDATMRNDCRPGWRNDSRISVGSFNVRSLKGDKWKLACHEFASRNFFICGTSEHWMSGSGILVDEESGVRFIYIGHDETENSKSG